MLLAVSSPAPETGLPARAGDRRRGRRPRIAGRAAPLHAEAALSTTKSGKEYVFSHVPIARGLNYGSARKRQAGGAGNKWSGLGSGGRHGMDSNAVRGLGRKVKPLKLQNGDSVYVDILCNKCGYEQPPLHRRLRCDSCGMPLALLDMADAYAGKQR